MKETPRCEVGASQRDLTVREQQLPVGPSQRCRESRSVQDVPWRLGRRICLLKGCEQTFPAAAPVEPLLQFGLPGGGPPLAAGGWPTVVIGPANRVSAAGEHRPVAIGSVFGNVNVPNPARAAMARAIPTRRTIRNSCCRRPGCYEGFAKTARSPLQKFCSAGVSSGFTSCVDSRATVAKAAARCIEQVGWRADDSW